MSDTTAIGTGNLVRRDELRNLRLIEMGWDVMRLWVYEESATTCRIALAVWRVGSIELIN